MKEPSELAKALDVILKNSALESTNGSSRNGYATPPIVTYGEENAPEGEVHLRDYWRTIRKRIWLILSIAIIVSTLAAIKQARLSDIYQARARVQVDKENYSPALGASKGDTFYVEAGEMDPDYFNTQIQILTSPTLLRRVARTLDLEHNRDFLNPPVMNGSTWQSVLRMFGLAHESQQAGSRKELPVIAETNDGISLITTNNGIDDIADVDRLSPYVESLQGMVDVEQVKRTRLIDIQCTHNDPRVAAKVVNAVADAFGLWNLEVRTRTNTIAGTYLQKRVAELQSQIRNGEEQLVNYAQTHEIISLDASQNTVVERLAGLNRQSIASFPPTATDVTAENRQRQWTRVFDK